MFSQFASGDHKAGVDFSHRHFSDFSLMAQVKPPDRLSLLGRASRAYFYRAAPLPRSKVFLSCIPADDPSEMPSPPPSGGSPCAAYSPWQLMRPAFP